MKGMKSYNTLNDYYRTLFGERPLKSLLMQALIVPIETEQSPTVAVLCTVSGSGDAIVGPRSLIREQFYKEIDFMHRKWPDVKKYLVYFQNFTNTHDKVEVIRERKEQAINEPGSGRNQHWYASGLFTR